MLQGVLMLNILSLWVLRIPLPIWPLPCMVSGGSR